MQINIYFLFFSLKKSNLLENNRVSYVCSIYYVRYTVVVVVAAAAAASSSWPVQHMFVE
jgi:hypothetical protein